MGVVCPVYLVCPAHTTPGQYIYYYIIPTHTRMLHYTLLSPFVGGSWYKTIASCFFNLLV